MGRPPCCDKSNVKRGLWTAEEDAKILAYISTHGTGNWTAVPKKAGLKRCGKSCRLRWTNYLRPDLKHESFTTEEEQMILSLHATLGSRWSIIAAQLPGRTDNDVKNYWNTKLRKKLLKMGIDPVTHKPISQIIADYGRIGLLKGGCSSSNTTTTNNKCGPAPYQTLNTTRISCFNRGLKNAFMPRWGQVQTPLHSGSNFSITTTATTEPTQDGLLSNTPWDLLTQLQAIQQVASSYNNQQTFQTHFFSESSSSSSSSTSLSNHQGKIRTNVPPPFPCQPSQPQNTSSSTSTSATSFSWSDFLSDEAFLPPNYREEDFPAVSSTESSSNKRIHDEIFSPNPQFGYTAPDNLKCNGVTEIGNGASAYQHGYVGGSCDGNTGGGIGQTLGAPPDDCFVETILERDSAMLWEFPDLLDNP